MFGTVAAGSIDSEFSVAYDLAVVHDKTLDFLYTQRMFRRNSLIKNDIFKNNSGIPLCCANTLVAITNVEISGKDHFFTFRCNESKIALLVCCIKFDVFVVSACRNHDSCRLCGRSCIDSLLNSCVITTGSTYCNGSHNFTSFVCCLLLFYMLIVK